MLGILGRAIEAHALAYRMTQLIGHRFRETTWDRCACNCIAKKPLGIKIIMALFFELAIKA